MISTVSNQITSYHYFKNSVQSYHLFISSKINVSNQIILSIFCLFVSNQIISTEHI